ncbi:type II secretion system secretin GspD [Panacagrimonas sp.]|uniref:type II secretion system secretin GspD n=1 Tax=Panacagrimonas sp. TaxID=2480088 RepID=UPI003B5169FB
MNSLVRALLAVAIVYSGAIRADVTLNLKDADITTLIQTVSEVTGRNFIVDPRVKGKVTVISSSPMNSSGLYETFLAVLQVQGFAAIPSGDTVKIVPETNARQDGGSYSSGGAGLAIDEVVTHVYAIQNVSAAQLVPILRPLVPQWGHLAAYAPSNMLIISDRAANVQRLERLIRQIDQSGDRGIEIVRLEHATASEVVRVLTSLNQGDKQGQQDPTQRPVAVIADERSNAVLIAGDRAERQKLLEIVGQIDIPVGEDGATQVVYLRYASAENLAPILEGYAQQVNQTAPGAAPAGGAQAANANRGGGSGDVRVLADPDTNAIIITAPPKTMRQVRDVIAQLDIRRAQVLVEGIIAEVSASRSSSLGIDWAVFNGERIAAAGILDPATLGAVQGLGQLGSTGTGTSSSANSDLAALGLLGNGINIAGGRFGGSGTSFAILLKAIKGDGDSNVLSTPTLVTMDNEEAEISVGQEVPFLTGSFSNTGATGGSQLNPFQTIERKDVGLTLGITPQINEGNSIKLELNLEVSSLAPGSGGGAVDLVTNKRTLTNTVSVEDGQVLVLGGLIDDNYNDTQRGVPFLSDIPLIGSLFRFRSVNKDKRNLMIFIKPAILRRAADGDYYSRRKYEDLRTLQHSSGAGKRIPLIGGERILLDPYDAYAARDEQARIKRQAAAAEDAARAKPDGDDPRPAVLDAPRTPPGGGSTAPPDEPVPLPPADGGAAPAIEQP